MPATPDLQALYVELRALLHKSIGTRNVVIDGDGHFYVNEVEPDGNGKRVFCCSVKIGSGKVQLHMMPIYTHPALLTGISEALKKRMQGKSCFNFAKPDPALFQELDRLIERALADKR
jgi:hypothetical protein